MCGAHSPCSFARSAQPRDERVRVVVLAVQHALVGIDVLLHEGALARAKLEHLVGRAQIGDGHAVSIASACGLGFYMGYAPPGTSPLEPIAMAQEAERLGYDSAWAAEAWGTDCVTVLSWLGATTERIKLGVGDHADPRPDAVEHGDDRGDARSALGRSLPPRPRHVRAAGRRGLARRAVGQAAREDARVRRDRAHGAPPRAARAPRHALRHPALERHRPRQAAQAHGAPACARTSRSTSR